MEKGGSIRSPSEFLYRAAARYESYPAIYYGGNVWSYSDIKNMARSLAGAILDKFSVKKGDLIGVCLPQSIQAFLSYHALWNDGLVAVPIDTKMPISAIDSIVSSGKISGIITYEGLYSKINREDTSSIFNLLTDPGDFLSHFQSPSEDFLIYKPKGTRQRAVFEEICYGNETDPEKVDPYTDNAIANIIWNRSGSFSIAKFTSGTVADAGTSENEKIISKENAVFLQNYEPSDSGSVILSYLYPLSYGQTVAFDRLHDKEDLKKVEKRMAPDNSLILNLLGRKSGFLESLGQKERNLIALVFSRGRMPERILSSLKEKKSSVFTFLYDQHTLIPVFMKQESENGRYMKFVEDREILSIEAIDGRINITGSAVASTGEDEMQETDIVMNRENPEERIFMEGNSILIGGRSFPLSHMESYLSSKLGVTGINIKLEKDQLKLVSAKKIDKKELEELFKTQFPPEFSGKLDSLS